ncbi:MAG: alternative ribosome rescue aminoacyl-tRNA hydrolase ArfB [Gemmatimonadota bacterium]
MTDALLPPEPEAIVVAPDVRIPVAEIELRGITGGGPGGQHVNRSATRVALRWNLQTTRALSAEQRARVADKLGSRLDADGTLRIVAGEYRSQLQNRRAAIERLVALLARALVVQPKRKATRPTHGSVERRLDAKRQRSDTKRGRRFDADE